MILADKIVTLRRKNGWSQEDLAEKMEVSRQAVSKWESAQTAPDLEKILALSKLFGVTTDYLLKDEIEEEKFTEDADLAPVKRVSLALANEFLEWRKQAAKRIAAATFLCIVAVIPLLLLGAASEAPGHPISENLAAGAGLIFLFLLVAAAAAIFVSCGFRNAPYEFIDREPFETEYGVDGMVKEKQKAYRPVYAKYNVVATCLCILSPVPLFIGTFTEKDEKDIYVAVSLAVLLLLAGIGTMLFILAGVRFASMQKLLKEGGYAPRDRRQERIRETVSTVYWLSAVAIYLGWSFLTNDWGTTWVVWPIAGVLFAVVMSLYSLFADSDKENKE